MNSLFGAEQGGVVTPGKQSLSPASTNIGLIVHCGAHEFGIQINEIECILRLGPDEGVQTGSHPTLQLFGEEIPLVSLAVLLGFGKPENDFPARRSLVVLRNGKRRMAVAVDEAPGEQAMVIKPCGPAFTRSDMLLSDFEPFDEMRAPSLLQVAELFAAAATRFPR